MTPRDWDKIEKLLGPMADQKTVEAIKALVEAIETNLKGSLTANVVKRVQRGTITIAVKTNSATATINAVDTAKAAVLFGGFSNGNNYNMSNVSPQYLDVRLELTSSTVITATRGGSSSEQKDGEITIPYQVVEFY